jgi:cytochrome c
VPIRIILLIALTCALLAACDRRGDAIRDSLSPEERVVFDRGARASQPCWTCHDIYGNEHKIGPGLQGVFGRRAGGAEGFGYSEAMKNAGVVWDDRSMGSFLSNGQRLIPGNRMVYSGVATAGQLDAIVFYLKHATRPGPP